MQKVDEIHADIVKIEENIPSAAAVSRIEVGSFVRLRAGGATGRVTEISNKKAMVEMGGLTITVLVRDLLPAAEPIKQIASITSTDLERLAAFDAKLDIRGMMKDEALTVLEKFVDNALLSSATTLRILHGKGTGILRQVVRQKLREYGGNVARRIIPNSRMAATA